MTATATTGIGTATAGAGARREGDVSSVVPLACSAAWSVVEMRKFAVFETSSCALSASPQARI